MSLSHNQLIIAETHFSAVQLRQIVGAYELHFIVELKINSFPSPYEFQVDLARATVTGTDRKKYDLGVARTDRVRFEQTYPDFSQNSGVDFWLTISPQQATAIENIRDGGDLNFRLNLKGISTHEEERAELYDEISLMVPSSSWIKQLKQSGYIDILLLEVPFPAFDLPSELNSVKKELQEAQRHFMAAEYTACISACRKAIQEFGHLIYGDEKWAEQSTKKVKSGTRSMSKADREQAIFSMLRNYTHQSHHGEGEGGFGHYTRADANMVLRMCAAMICGALKT